MPDLKSESDEPIAQDCDQTAEQEVEEPVRLVLRSNEQEAAEILAAHEDL